MSKKLVPSRRLEIFNKKPGLGVASAILTWIPNKHSAAYMEAEIRKQFRLPPTTTFTLQSQTGEVLAISPNLPANLIAYLHPNSPPPSPASAAAAAAAAAGKPRSGDGDGLSLTSAGLSGSAAPAMAGGGSGGSSSGAAAGGGFAVAATPTAAAALAFLDSKIAPLPDVLAANSNTHAATAAAAAAGTSGAGTPKSRTPVTPTRTIKRTLAVQAPPAGSALLSNGQPNSAPLLDRSGSVTSNSAAVSPIRETASGGGHHSTGSGSGGWTNASGRPPSAGRSRVIPFAHRPLHQMSESLSFVTLGGLAPKALPKSLSGSNSTPNLRHRHPSHSSHTQFTQLNNNQSGGGRRTSDPSIHDVDSDTAAAAANAAGSVVPETASNESAPHVATAATAAGRSGGAPPIQTGESSTAATTASTSGNAPTGSDAAPGTGTANLMVGVSASVPNSPTNRMNAAATPGFGTLNENGVSAGGGRSGGKKGSKKNPLNKTNTGLDVKTGGGRSGTASKRTSMGYGGFGEWAASAGSAVERAASREISVEKIMLLLNSITQASTKVDIRELTEQITEQVNTLFASDRTFLFLVNESTPHNNSSNNTAHSSTTATCWTADPSIPLPIAVGHGIVGWVASKGHSVQLPLSAAAASEAKDKAKEKELEPVVNHPLMGFTAKSCLCVPVFAPDKASNSVTGASPTVTAVLYTARMGIPAKDDATAAAGGATPPKAGGLIADPYTAHDMLLFKLLSTHVGIMIRNIKLYDAAQKIEARNQTLCSLLNQLPTRLDDPTFVPSILRQTQEHILADRCSLFLLDPIENRLWAKNSDTGEDIYIPKDKGIMGQAVRTKKITNVADVRTDPNFNQHIDIRTGYCTQSIVAAPITDEDGTVLGVTSFINRASNTTFSYDEQQLIEAISKLAAVGLRWPVIRGERDSLRARFHCLREITSIIGGGATASGAGGGEEISSLIRKVMGKAQEMLGVDRCSMFLLDPDTKELFSRTADGQEIRFSQYLGIAGHCVLSGKPICVKDVKSDNRFLAAVDRRTGFQTTNILCVPIRDTDSQIIGVMQCLNKLDGEFDADDEESLVLISHLCSFLLLRHAYLQQRKKSNQQLTSLFGATAGSAAAAAAAAAAGGAATPLTAGTQQSNSPSPMLSAINASVGSTPPPLYKSISMAVTSSGAVAASRDKPSPSQSQSTSGLSTPLSAAATASSNLSSSLLTSKLQALTDKQSRGVAVGGSSALNDEKKMTSAGAGGGASNWVLFDIQGKGVPATVGVQGQSGGRRSHPNFPPALEHMTVFDSHAKKYDLIKSGDAARDEKQQRMEKERKVTGSKSTEPSAMENAHALFETFGTHKTFGKLTHLFDFEGRKYSVWSPKRYISLRAKVDRDYLKSWDFNALTLSTDEILANVICMLEELHLVQLMDINKLCKFTGNIARSYRANPYHNFYHALDTMQAVYTFMTTSHVVNGALNTLDRLSGLLGAFCHDVDHPGVTSNFLINVNSPLALFYNDESVLENYHCSVSFLLMRDEENNIFSKLSPPDLKYVRKVVVATIMATDMAHHFRHITNLKTRIQNLPMKPFASQSFDDRLMLTMLCMKCADLIHLVRPFKVAREWEELIQQEFFLQGDMEKELRLPIGPCNDRFTVDLAASQVYFYNAFGEPLFGSLCSFAPDLQHRLDTLRANCKIWAEEAKRNKLLKAAQAAAQQQKDDAAAAKAGTTTTTGTAATATNAASAPATGAGAGTTASSTAAGGGGSNSSAAPTAAGSTAPSGGGGTAPPQSNAPPAISIANPNTASGNSSLGVGGGTISIGAGGGLVVGTANATKMPLSGGRTAGSLSRHASMAAPPKAGGASLFAEATKATAAAAVASSPIANTSAGAAAAVPSVRELTKPPSGSAAAAAIALASAATSPPPASNSSAPGGVTSPLNSTATVPGGSGANPPADSGESRRAGGAKLHARRTALSSD